MRLTQGPHALQQTNPNLYPIVGAYLKRNEGPNGQTSFENEAKTRNPQIRGEIGVRKGAKSRFENEPKRTPLRADFWAGRVENRQTNPNEPKKRTRDPIYIQRESGRRILGTVARFALAGRTAFGSGNQGRRQTRVSPRVSPPTKILGYPGMLLKTKGRK